MNFLKKSQYLDDNGSWGRFCEAKAYAMDFKCVQEVCDRVKNGQHLRDVIYECLLNLP